MLGPYLRSLRTANNKSVLEVQDALGIHRQTIYLWEGPRSRPDPIDIRRLLTHYGATEDEITRALHLRSLMPGAEVADDSEAGAAVRQVRA